MMWRLSIPLLLVLASSNAFSIDIYPAKGQSPEQQAKDTAECQDYAKKQTGFDPQQALSNQSQPEAVLPRRRARIQSDELKSEKDKTAQYNEAEGTCLKGKGYSVG